MSWVMVNGIRVLLAEGATVQDYQGMVTQATAQMIQFRATWGDDEVFNISRSTPQYTLRSINGEDEVIMGSVPREPEGEAEEKPIRREQIGGYAPALHTYDSEENFIGLAVSMGTGFAGPFELITCQLSEIYPFEWGQWNEGWMPTSPDYVLPTGIPPYDEGEYDEEKLVIGDMHVIWDIPADHDYVAYVGTAWDPAGVPGDRYSWYQHYFCLIEDWDHWFNHYNGGVVIGGGAYDWPPWWLIATKVDDQTWEEEKQGTYVQLTPRTWWSSWSYSGQEPSAYMAWSTFVKRRGRVQGCYFYGLVNISDYSSDGTPSYPSWSSNSTAEDYVNVFGTNYFLKAVDATGYHEAFSSTNLTYLTATDRIAHAEPRIYFTDTNDPHFLSSMKRYNTDYFEYFFFNNEVQQYNDPDAQFEMVVGEPAWHYIPGISINNEPAICNGAFSLVRWEDLDEEVFKDLGDNLDPSQPYLEQ